jgi:hypothetical protein
MVFKGNGIDDSNGTTFLDPCGRFGRWNDFGEKMTFFPIFESFDFHVESSHVSYV